MTTIDLADLDSRAAIVDRLSAGVPYVVMFGGQGSSYHERLTELRATYGSVVGADRLWADALDRLCPVLADLAPWWPVDPRDARWFDRMEGSAAPPPESTAVSVPSIVFTQLLERRALEVNGLDVEAAPPTSVIGHSQGALTALAARGALGEVDVLALAHLIGVAVARVSSHAGLSTNAAGRPMVAVTGVTRFELDAVLASFGSPQRTMTDSEPSGPVDLRPAVVIGVVNGPERHVLVGPPETLAQFRSFAEDILDATWDEPSVDAGFHHPALAPAASMVHSWAERCGITSGSVVDDIVARPLDWPSVVSDALGADDADTKVRWVLDLGPGVATRRLTAPLVRGTGIGIASVAPSRGVSEVVTPGAAPTPERPYVEYRPGLLHLDDGRVVLDTKLSRLTGHSPLILAGMTPTTVDAPIVAAAANAGVWAELAGGGQVTAEILHERLVELSELLDPGVGVHFNALHLDPYLWSLHLGRRGALLDELRRGAPVRGVTISAGSPELDEATELVQSLSDLGVETVTFKPGTVDGIRRVIAIAEAVAPRAIVVQIEGGRAGGHHSWEALDDLLLATYGDLRAHDNVVICVGGGLGSSAAAMPYLDGSWATRHGRPPMPVDGILIGTAAMACAEATTSPQVKQRLRECAGTQSVIAAGTAADGVASGRSQLGADLHELDNAASRVGRLLDEVAGDADAVAARHDEIVEALDTTAKPYFGNVDEMTYLAVLERFRELCAIGRGGRYEDGAWLDRSWRTRFIDLAQRAEARLDPIDHGTIPTRFGGLASVDDPAAAIQRLAAELPSVATTRLHPADVAHFVEVCRQPGKPVPFVPVIDAEVRRWWRSDSLWQAHDDRYPADAVIVIPGPVAVGAIDRVDEPVAALFARLEDEIVDRLATDDSIVRRAAPRRRASGIADAVGLVLAEPAVTWTGRRRRNPALAIAPANEWVIDSEGVAHTNDDRAQLVPTPDGVDLVVTVAPLGAAPRNARLSLRTTEGTAARVIVDDDAAIAWSDALMQIAAGDDERRFDRARDLDHAALFGSETPLPDAVVALVWPAVFEHLGGSETVPVRGGFGDLVHLDHEVVLVDADALESIETGTSAITRVEVTDTVDTTAGRVVSVDVSLAAEGTETTDSGRGTPGPVARLRERFLVRGVTGEGAPGAPDATSVTTDRMVDTERRTLATRSITAPASAAAMAAHTGDHNPLHSSTEIARIAGFASPIVHGMWVSAAMQEAVGSATGHAPVAWQAQFLAPLTHGADVEVTVVRIGQVDGGLVVETTARSDDGLVARAVGRVPAPRTCYAFPGQGIQRVGMGLDALGRSTAARDVWERADRHTRTHLGFSVLHVVRDNPTRLDVSDETYRHPDGVLFLTQFTQVAMATLAAAQVAELREAGGFATDPICCGHSVGECNALAAATGILGLEDVVELVFQRGLAMHRLVPRDSEGNSRYRLAAARPSEAGLDEAGLVALVETIAADLGPDESLQVVNYNLRDRQYAIAGTIDALARLEDDLEDRRRRRGGKGVYVQIPGIDVPFHSAVLRDGVADFRNRLDDVLPRSIDPDVLVGRYIPNLVPRLFSLDRSFVEEIVSVVPSQSLADVLDDWDGWNERPGELCRAIVLELLAWQFASPVRWIETQDLLLGTGGDRPLVERFVEIGLGSQPTLTGLARQTITRSSDAAGNAAVMNIELDRPTLFGLDADEPEPAEAVDAAPLSTSEPVAPDSGQAPTPAAPTAASAAPTDTTDLPWTPGDGVRLLLSWWTKIRPDQLGSADSIEGLCDGASSRRNQLLMDLGAEFGLGAIDGAAEATLDQLIDEVTSRTRSYRALGPTLRATVDEQLRRVTGPARSRPAAVADRLRDHWGLGDGWAVHVGATLASATRDGVSGRGGDLAWIEPTTPQSSADLDGLIDAAVTAVAGRHGRTVAPLTVGGEPATLDAASAAALLDSVTGPDGVLADVARVLDQHLGRRDVVEPFEHDAEAADLPATIERELGSDWPTLVAPAFDRRRAVLIDDRWAGQRDDLLRLGDGRLDDHERDQLTARLTRLTPEARAHAAWWRDHADDPEVRARFDAVLAAESSDAEPLAFSRDLAVVTGASPGSIAASVVARLLAGGATVVATASALDTDRVAFFRDLFHEHAVPEAAVYVVPANLASFADVDALVEWTTDELERPPTLLFPFAAPPVRGSLADVGPRAEAEMRVLLWSVERLIAGFADARSRTGSSDSVHVVLPGSPNRGTFGGDGAYGEAKAALDALTRRSQAESWADHVSIVHASIGWVRGTGLMGGNDRMVPAVEAAGVRTWSTDEMAAELAALGTPETRRAAAAAPLVVDLTGGLADVELDLRALASGPVDTTSFTNPAAAEDEPTIEALPAPPAARHSAPQPWPATTARLDDTVVIVGIGEVGPLGSARTRFDVEIDGRFSPAAVAELAWLCGLIRWESQPTAGFYDTESDELVPEHELVERYHDRLLEHSGIRVLEDDGPMSGGAVPLLASVYLERDLAFRVDDATTAAAFRDADPERTTVADDGDGSWTVTRRAGTEVRVPRHIALPRHVGAQLPAGFDPAAYGIPADMLGSIDRVAAWNLVATVDAFLDAGIEPTELLRWVHPADVANTQGTGIGGISAIRSLYVDSLLGEARANDVLQEALPNVIAAHVMQSYVGGYGAMVHPVAACATAAVSVEEAFDKIRAGRAKVVVAGGYDDYGPEGLVGFAAMNATASSDELTAAGIDPRRMSRPNDRRRGGFVEGQGGGTIVLARGDVAAELGLPVKGVVAWAGSFSDGVNTSIPAPGVGLVAAARGGAASALSERLAALGVTADDIAVVSKHDTSTTANDPNESLVHERLATALGRDAANPIVVVSQKSVTGHAKGGAAAFQIAGLCQVLERGEVPGNRSLDCVDPDLAVHPRLVWPTRPVRVRARAGLVTSLGFGHVAAILAIVHPDAFVALLPETDRHDYLQRSAARTERGSRRRLAAMTGGPPLYVRPDRRLGDHDRQARELAVLVDDTARLGADGVYALASEGGA